MKFRHRFFQLRHRKAQEIILFQAVSIRASSMRSHRLRRFLSSSLWYRVLTDTSRLLLVSEMRTQEQTVHPVSSISSTLRWLLLLRKMYLQLQKKFFTKHSQSLQIKRFLSLRLFVFRMPRVCSNTVQTSLTSVTHSLSLKSAICLRKQTSSHSLKRQFVLSMYRVPQSSLRAGLRRWKNLRFLSV